MTLSTPWTAACQTPLSLIFLKKAIFRVIDIKYNTFILLGLIKDQVSSCYLLQNLSARKMTWDDD